MKKEMPHEGPQGIETNFLERVVSRIQDFTKMAGSQIDLLVVAIALLCVGLVRL
jgi:hypothetical protein